MPDYSDLTQCAEASKPSVALYHFLLPENSNAEAVCRMKASVIFSKGASQSMEENKPLEYLMQAAKEQPSLKTAYAVFQHMIVPHLNAEGGWKPGGADFARMYMLAIGDVMVNGWEPKSPVFER